RIEPEFSAVLQVRYMSLLLLGRRDEAAALTKNPKFPRDPGAQLVAALESGDVQTSQALLPRIIGIFKDSEAPGNIRLAGSVRLIPYLVQHGQKDAGLQMLSGMTSVGDLPSYSML